VSKKSKRTMLLSIKAELNRAKIALENGEPVDPERIKHIEKKLKTLGYADHQISATINNKLLSAVMGGNEYEI